LSPRTRWPPAPRVGVGKVGPAYRIGLPQGSATGCAHLTSNSDLCIVPGSAQKGLPSRPCGSEAIGRVMVAVEQSDGESWSAAGANLVSTSQTAGVERDVPPLVSRGPRSSWSERQARFAEGSLRRRPLIPRIRRLTPPERIASSPGRWSAGPGKRRRQRSTASMAGSRGRVHGPMALAQSSDLDASCEEAALCLT
jgi:hypothetical protein